MSLKDERFILNANRNQDNSVNFEEFHEITTSVLNKTLELILPLCGPKALHNLVVYEHINIQLMSNVFSNDGVHNLKSLDFASPIEDFIVNYIKYVAECVEKAAGDGTSTAIYLAARITQEALNAAKLSRDIANKRIKDPIMRTGFVQHHIKYDQQCLIKQLQRVLTILDRMLKIDIKDPSFDPIIKRALIRKLASTTSRNNEILTDYVTELYCELPETLYEQTFYQRLPIETEEPLKVEYPEYDLLLSVTPATKTTFNAALSTEYHSDNIDLLPVATQIDSVKADILIGYLKQRTSEKPLLLLVTGVDPTANVHLERFIDGNKVIMARLLATHHAFTNNPLEVQTVLAMAGRPTDVPHEIPDFEAAIVPDVKIRLTHRELEIYHLFEHQTDSRIHPYYTNPGEHPPYDKLRAELTSQIRRLTGSHNRKEVFHETKEFIRIYRHMVGSRLPILFIGGSSVEHLQMVNIVDDTLGVVSVAMKHGVILDAIPKLQALFDLSEKEPTYDQTSFDIAKILEDFWRLTYYLSSDDDTYDDGLNRIDFYDITTRQLIRDNLEFSKWFVSTDSDGYRDWCELSVDNVDQLTTVQSYQSLRETFKRLIETVPNLMISDKIIVPHAIMSRKEQKDG